MREIRIVAEESHGRLDAFLAGREELGLSRSRIKGLIEEGHVTLNGVVPKAKQSVEPGDEIVVAIPDPEPVDLEPEDIPLDIVYEDEDLLVINKQRGLVVHPAAGHWRGTLVHAVLDKVEDLEGIGGELRPGIVHRLDKDTTGLLVVAKTERAMASLQDQIREHTARRIYWALVHGNSMPDAGRIEAPIGRHPTDRKRMAVNTKTGREAITRFRVLERYRGYALLECQLETGRTHQIRVHLSFIGHPVVSDPLYGTRKPHLGMPPQALHARQLGFRHPATGEWMEFTAEPPADMMAVIQRLREEA
ncbi:23S rRNA pseudouridine1911/1915/1917 synthase [Symbiobacterium terraclitae]|uniref:Pseudouridine synthase n=1 Tax=Symbiobacterium terraclitae TaxID=557451 RepID=A0ABS4JNL4_9FIRM|nr:23S rRNA pseudouridine1911/1915/1917 synthase [Symbiobacterium terraclitae]